MFKKTLLALSLATLASTASAGTLVLAASTGASTTTAGSVTCDNTAAVTDAICIATEVAVIGEAGQTTPVPFDLDTASSFHNADASGALINYTPNAIVPVGSRLTFTLSNGFFKDEDYNLTTTADSSVAIASLANVIKDADGNITAIEVTVGTALVPATSYTLVNAGEATADPVDVAEDADTISLLFKDGIASGNQIGISVSARDNLGTISAAAATEIPVIAFAKQFVKATTFAADNAVVDVAMLRKDFDTTDAADTTGGDLNTTVNLTTDITDNAANLTVEIAAANVMVTPTLTDTGSFSGINHSTTVTTGLTNPTKSTFDAVNIVQNTTDLTKATVPAKAGTTAFDADLTLEINNDDAQSTRAVSLTQELDYTAANAAFGKETLDYGTVTTFSLNGKNAEVPYMPFGDNTQIILRATNTSTQTGDLSVRYMEEGSQGTWKDLGVVGSVLPGVNNIADVVLNAIKADSGLTKGKLALDITVNAPTANVNFYAAYKVVSETDRGFVGNF